MIIGAILSKAGRQAVDWFFPPRCAVCGSAESFLCLNCRESLPRAEQPRCAVCWQPGDWSVCPKCQRSRPAFDGLRSPYVFEAGARELVHGLKYQHQSVLAEPMAELLFRYLLDDSLPADVLVPVPLFFRRERIRGYNQSTLLARALARHLGLPADDRTLVRARNTASQARTSNVEERGANVRDAFRCRDRRLAGKRVLLIDDVSTTGATLDSCARALLDGGAASVWALTFAHED
jgi:competence protein ComFC